MVFLIVFFKGNIKESEEKTEKYQTHCAPANI